MRDPLVEKALDHLIGDRPDWALLACTQPSQFLYEVKNELNRLNDELEEERKRGEKILTENHFFQARWTRDAQKEVAKLREAAKVAEKWIREELCWGRHDDGNYMCSDCVERRKILDILREVLGEEGK
jgi:hypothetical protein